LIRDTGTQTVYSVLLNLPKNGLVKVDDLSLDESYVDGSICYVKRSDANNEALHKHDEWNLMIPILEEAQPSIDLLVTSDPSEPTNLLQKLRSGTGPKKWH
jgi:hypothetical protein